MDILLQHQNLVITSDGCLTLQRWTGGIFEMCKQTLPGRNISASDAASRQGVKNTTLNQDFTYIYIDLCIHMDNIL